MKSIFFLFSTILFASVFLPVMAQDNNGIKQNIAKAKTAAEAKKNAAKADVYVIRKRHTISQPRNTLPADEPKAPKKLREIKGINNSRNIEIEGQIPISGDTF